jgi:hypothetical protein
MGILPISLSSSSQSLRIKFSKKLGILSLNKARRSGRIAKLQCFSSISENPLAHKNSLNQIGLILCKCSSPDRNFSVKLKDEGIDNTRIPPGFKHLIISLSALNIFGHVFKDFAT